MGTTQSRAAASVLPFMVESPAQKKQVSSALIKEGRFVITPAVAEQILERFNYRNQRQVQRTHVAKLAVQMKAGVWTPGSQIAFGEMPDQTIHLVNGQHRLHAVIESGSPIEVQMLLVPVADEAELHALYYRFDTVQRSRSDNMIIRSVGICDQLGIQKTLASSAFRASVYLAAGLRAVHGVKRDPALGTPDGKLAVLEHWWPFVKQYGDLIEGARVKIKQRLLNAQVMTVALVTLRYQPVRAAEFWQGVANDDGLRKGDPRQVMLKVLEDYNFKENTESGMIYTSNCWDAWFQNRQLTYTRMFSYSVCAPAGTPFAQAKRRG